MTTSYVRHDIVMHLSAEGAAAVLTVHSPEGTTWERRVPRTLVDGTSTIPEPLRETVRSAVSETVPISEAETLSRVTVAVGVRDWAALPWE